MTRIVAGRVVITCGKCGQPACTISERQLLIGKTMIVTMIRKGTSELAQIITERAAVECMGCNNAAQR